MRLMKYILSVVVMVAVLWAAILPVAASPQEAPQAQTNLLSNGDFEASFIGVALGWSSWSVPPASGDAPCSRRTPSAGRATEGRRVQAGSGSQQLLGAPQSAGDAGGTFLGGLAQTVNVTPGKKYKFTIWASGWFSNGDNPAVSESTGSLNIQIGIGQGATYAADPGIVRSNFGSPKDSFQQFSVEAVATGGQLTVFTYANPDSCAKHTEVFFDSASLVEVGGDAPAPTAGPPPTAGPTAPPARVFVDPNAIIIPTPNAEGKIIYTVPPNVFLADICAALGRNDLKCVEEIVALNGGINPKFISIGQKIVLPSKAGGQPQPTAAPTTAPQPTATKAAAQPTAGGGAQPTLPAVAGTKVPGGGQICITLYNDANGNGVLDAGEGLVKGGTFGLLDTTNSAQVATYVTDGASEPKCFDSLKAGNYRIVSTPPTGYRSTSKAEWELALTAGGTANLEFGAQATSGANGAKPATPTDNSALTRALLAGAGVVLLLIAAGVAGFLVLTRRR